MYVWANGRGRFLVHTPAPSLAGASQAGALAASQSSTLPSSRPGTPPRDAGTPAAAAGTPTPNGGGSVNKDGTVILDCVGCGRPVRCDADSPPPLLLAFGPALSLSLTNVLKKKHFGFRWLLTVMRLI